MASYRKLPAPGPIFHVEGPLIHLRRTGAPTPREAPANSAAGGSGSVFRLDIPAILC